MTFADFIVYGTYIALALVVSITIVLIFAVFLHAAGKFRRSLFAVIFILLAFYGMISVAASGRVLDAHTFTEGAESFGLTLAEYIHPIPSRLVLLVLLICCGAAIVAWVLEKRERYEPKTFVLLLGLFCFYIFSEIFPAVFGYRPHFGPRYFFPILVMLGLFMSVPKDFRRVILSLKLGLAIIVLGSLISGLLMPDLAVETAYVGLIPAIGIRLHGLTYHANLLAPVALTLLIIELAYPFSSRWVRVLVVVSSAVTITLTQSKTTIVAGLIAATIVCLYRYWQNIRYMQEWNAPSKRTNKIVILSGLMLSLIGVLVFVILFDWLPIRWDILNRAALSGIETASGRAPIWEAAIREGMNHPIFGNGPDIWSEEFRRPTGLLSTGHAHNQYLQVFIVGGSVGLFGCLVYLLILARFSFSVARGTSGMSLGLFVILLVRSATEVPLSLNSITSGDFLSHLAFVFFLVAAMGRKSLKTSTKTIDPMQITRAHLELLEGKS